MTYLIRMSSLPVALFPLVAMAIVGAIAVAVLFKTVTAQAGLEDLRAAMLGRWEGRVARGGRSLYDYRTLIVDQVDSREGRFVASVRWNRGAVKDAEVEVLPSGRPMIRFSPPGGASIRIPFDGDSAQGTLKAGDAPDWPVHLRRIDARRK
jgi:hypothetical protein